MRKVILILLLAAVSFACGRKTTDKKDALQGELSVITVNYPLYYFTDKIAGDLVNLQYIIPGDVDPAYWVPNEKELGIYQSADIIIVNGGNYAKWIENVSLPSRRIVNTAASFENELISLNNLTPHNHGPDGEHEHSGYAFTTWLNFKFALKQAESIRAILVNKLPNKTEQLNENFEVLKSELENLDREMSALGPQHRENNLLASHPVYQYLSEEYGLTLHSVHFESSEIPSEEQWETLIQLANDSRANLMLWEDSPLEEVGSKLLEADIQVVVFNPCGNRPDSGDFATVMKQNINNLKRN